MKDAKKDKNYICLNAQGKGRLYIDNRTHVFSYQTHFDDKNNTLDLDFTFPIHGTESINIDYIGGEKRFILKSSFEKRLMRSEQYINPELIESFTLLWGEFFEDILKGRKGNLINDRGVKYRWNYLENNLVGVGAYKEFKAKISLKYLSTSTVNGKDSYAKIPYFERVDLNISSPDRSDQIRLELIVRKCLEM